MTLEKSDVDLDLPTLEQAAELAVEESKATNKIATGVDQLKLGARAASSAVDSLSNQIEELNVTSNSASEKSATNSEMTQSKSSVTCSDSKNEGTPSNNDSDSDASSSDDESDGSSESNSDSSSYYTETEESSETESSSDSEDEEDEKENGVANVDNVAKSEPKQPLIEVLSSTDQSNTPTTKLSVDNNQVPENESKANWFLV